MTNMLQDIHIDHVVTDMKAVTARQVFRRLAENAAPHILCDEEEIFLRLLEKEKSERVAVNDGIAIPSLQLPALHHPFKLLAKLGRPVLVASADRKPVDIVCLLISPEKDGPLHLRRLARLSRVFRNQDLCSKIRSTEDALAIRNLLQTPQRWMEAA